MVSLKSKVTRKVLNYFFINPEEGLYVNELVKKLELDKRNLVKKLKTLEQEGIVVSRKRGNLKIYSINTKYPLYDEYKKIICKTLGFEANLKEALSSVDNIEQVYIYGSYAIDSLSVHSDIDILAVGEHDVLVLQRIINKFQREIDREINVVNMSKKEFQKRKRAKDAFIESVFSNKYIKVL